MSRKANPTVIGGFVVGAIALVVLGVLLFGGGKFFTKVNRYAVFFQVSVRGLQVGAPVTFRGIKIGDVVDLTPIVHGDTGDIDIKVIIEIPEDGDFDIIGPGEFARLEGLDGRQALDFLVKERGLRAKLALQSLVTGQLYVDLDFYPDSPVRLVGLPTRHPQLPTVETGAQKLVKAFQEFPIGEMTDKVQKALDAITALAASPKLPEIIAEMDAAVKDARRLIRDLTKTSEAGRAAMVQAKTTLALEEGKPGEIADALIDAEKNMSAAMKALREGSEAVGDAARGLKKVAEDVGGMLDDDAPIRAELESLIIELAAAARSIRIMADYLERHPESILKGKQ